MRSRHKLAVVEATQGRRQAKSIHRSTALWLATSELSSTARIAYEYEVKHRLEFLCVTKCAVRWMIMV